MIIDIHGHLNAPKDLYWAQAMLLASRGAHGPHGLVMTDEALHAEGQWTIDILDSVGTDLQLISPRPFSLMHSEKPEKMVHWWAEANNDTIARQVAMFPGRLQGVAALPQVSGRSPEVCLAELERAITELGFVGCLLNPDPGEGDGQTPPLGDEHWYPLWEKLVELDVPALVHSAACKNGRETYSAHFISEESLAILSLLDSRALVDFPSLKLIVSHGGGSVPYQIGRWRAGRYRGRYNQGGLADATFDESLRRLWFDTCLYSSLSLELLFRTVGADRCMFGTEKPGTGTVKDPETGRDMDDLKPVIEGLTCLTDADRASIFELNARAVFRL